MGGGWKRGTAMAHRDKKRTGNRAAKCTGRLQPIVQPRQSPTLHGRFYKSMLYPLLRRINDHLVRWACRKYKRLRRREKRARELLAGVARRFPGMFAHWRFGLKPAGWTMGAV